MMVSSSAVSSKDRAKPPPKSVVRSRWAPRPHSDDASIKTYDFAYLTGLPDPTLSSQVYAALKAILSTVFSHPLLVQSVFLIFGGCCSNVYALESILTLSASSGSLITFLQFLTITIYQLSSQLTFHVTSPPDPPPLQPTQRVWFPRLKRRKVPLTTWVMFAAQFVTINILNNAAFGYRISLPLHIILRSAGPVASMGLGAYWKRRQYSQLKIIAVALLFAGVVLAALSDAGSKTDSTTETTPSFKDNGTHARYIQTETDQSLGTNLLRDQIAGFVLLALALLLSAVLGIWSESLYGKYGRSQAIADEQLFYCHLLALPFFAFQANTLRTQYEQLRAASLAAFPPTPPPDFRKLPPMVSLMHRMDMNRPLTMKKRFWKLVDRTPRAIPFLAVNCLTQVACINGVHHLSTQTSALTVSIILNIRKLVSLLLSIWLFGNTLPLGVAIGAAVVFVGGGLYGIPDKKGKTKKEVKVGADGETKKDR